MNSTPPIPRGACVLVLNRQGQPLVVNRPSAPGMYCFPGGKLEEGETFLEAAVRETKEETGVILAPKDLAMVFRADCPNDDHTQWYDVALFVSTRPVEHIPGSEEADLVAQFGDFPDLLARSPFFAYNRAGLCLATGVFGAPPQNPADQPFFSHVRRVLLQALTPTSLQAEPAA